MDLHAATFEPLTGTTFTITGRFDDDEVLRTELELVAVDALEVGGPYEQFSLVLEGPRAEALDQGTYLVTHGQVELDPLFIVPVEDDHDVRRYASSFSVLSAPTDGTGAERKTS